MYPHLFPKLFKGLHDLGCVCAQVLAVVVAALVDEGVPVAAAPRALVDDLLASGACAVRVTPSLARAHFGRPGPHAALDSRGTALQVLRYCVGDAVASKQYGAVVGLPLVSSFRARLPLSCAFVVA